MTFDDGPHPIWTREIIRVLTERAAVPATFFVWGEQAVEHADVVDDILSAGHSVQPHCWHHRLHPDLTRAQIRGDVDRVVTLLGQLGAPGPRAWLRPRGQLNKGVTRRVARRRGLALTGWNVDSHDWDGRGGSAMYTAVKSRITELRDRKAVVLMHDNHVQPGPSSYRSDCQGTVDLVRRLIDDEQLSFVPRLRHGMPDNLNEQPGRGGNGSGGQAPGLAGRRHGSERFRVHDTETPDAPSLV